MYPTAITLKRRQERVSATRDGDEGAAAAAVRAAAQGRPRARPARHRARARPPAPAPARAGEPCWSMSLLGLRKQWNF